MRRKEGPIKKDKQNSLLPFMSRLLGNTWEEHIVPGTGPKSSSNFIQAPFPPSLTFSFPSSSNLSPQTGTCTGPSAPTGSCSPPTSGTAVTAGSGLLLR